MENNQKDTAAQNPEESVDKHVNYFAADDTDINEEESTENNRNKQEADSGSEGFFNEITQIEIRIDPGNEHHHRTDADDIVFNEEIDRSPRFEADAGGDGTGTAGPDPAE